MKNSMYNPAINNLTPYEQFRQDIANTAVGAALAARDKARKELKAALEDSLVLSLWCDFRKANAKATRLPGNRFGVQYSDHLGDLGFEDLSIEEMLTRKFSLLN